MARYTYQHVVNRIEFAASIVNASEYTYRSGSVTNGNSHAAVFVIKDVQFVIYAKTRPILMEKLDAFIHGAQAMKV